MRKLLLVGAALAALSEPAGAQIVCANCATEFGDVWRQAQIVAQWAQQIAQMKAQLQQQLQIYTSLSGLTNVSGLSSILNQTSASNPLGGVNVQSLVSGQGFGSLSGIASQFQQQNTFYMPQLSNFSGQMPGLLSSVVNLMSNRAQSTAGVQAAAYQLQQASTHQLAGLAQLQAEIDQQPDMQHMAAIQARINTAQANIAVQQNQLQQLAMLSQEQQAVFEQRERQAAFKSAEDWHNNTSPLP